MFKGLKMVSSNTGFINNELNDNPFSKGQIIRIKSKPNVQGVVLEIHYSKPENRYSVFVEGEKRMYYASQLEKTSTIEESRFVSCEDFHVNLTALLLKSPALSTLYSLNSARIDFIPYQFRPVLKFIRSDRPRLLIADGVGVGKTIEAGLILRELQARRDIRSILIICPRPLITEQKWQNEMKRFDEKFVHLDSKNLRYCINEMDLDGIWPSQYQRVIVPYSIFDKTSLYGSEKKSKGKRIKGLLNLDPPPRFDLVIVDEAHHIRNPDTFNNKAVSFFCDNAEAAIFLTATPIQLGNQDLFVLLKTLRPDLIIDRESFEHMAAPNPFINKAVMYARVNDIDWQKKVSELLSSAESTDWGRAILCKNPDFIKISSMLSCTTVSETERVEIISGLESMHTFNGIINRTRRRDIGDFTIRKPETVLVPFTLEQQYLHNDILKVQAEIFTKLGNQTNVNFIMTTIRRQLASCLFGLVPFLEEILSRHLDNLSIIEADDDAPLNLNESVDEILIQIRSILDRVKTLNPTDPKLDALFKVIRNKQKLPNNKLILFSSFRHTLNYIHSQLKDKGFRVGLIHGGTPDEERLLLRHRFEKVSSDEDSLDIMLFSEIGCEGLDYQFCDCIVNYDLPWNPMRIEQRIGRIDRQGQKSESIAILNFVTPGTIDADIYERCLLRIGIFEHSLGDSEGILGEITREIKDIAESYNISEEDKRMKFQQLADNKIRLFQEQEMLEQRQAELFGIRLPNEVMNKEIKDASSYWLSSNSLLNMVKHYLKIVSGSEQDYILGDKALKTLRLSLELRNKLLIDLQQLQKQSNMTYREWENWLKGKQPHLSITFESDCAKQQSDAIFITPVHPLTKQAALAMSKTKRVITALKVLSNDVPSGKYEFIIYQWRYHGIREDLVIQPVTTSEKLTLELLRLLETAEDAEMNEKSIGNLSNWDELDSYHYRFWADAREVHKQNTMNNAMYQRESLHKSHQARVSLLTDQMNQSNDEKIRRMHRSQIETAEADYTRRILELDNATEHADIEAEPVVFGVIEIKGGA